MSNSMLRMATDEPGLVGRLFVSALPAAAAGIGGRLRYRLELTEVGSYDVAIDGGDVRVVELGGFDAGGNGARRKDGAAGSGEDVTAEIDAAPASAGTDLVPVANGEVDFVMQTDPLTLARLARGESPLKLMLTGRLRIRGKRRRALRLRKMASGVTMRDVARAGVTLEPDLLYRALPYAIDPEWTRGERFCIAYEISGDESGPGGQWFVVVDDGAVAVRSSAPASLAVDATVRLDRGAWLQIVRGETTPGQSMRAQRTRVEGKMYPVTLLGRWIERAEGRDSTELERERRQAAIQAGRATWGSKPAREAPGGGDPALSEAAPRPKGAQLLSYEELYALWERQNWKAHEIDFSVDKRHWLATPAEGQRDTIWSLANFYLGEERVAADLAPFVLAAPTGEAEIFLATQLVDEARHAAFFDRFMAEVMALEPDDIRGRLASLETGMEGAWKEMFDGHLRGIARRLQSEPDNLDLFVEGVVVYHLVIEGVLAMTGQHQILEYLGSHDIYPGFREGFSLVERDEHRHIAFGVRFLKQAVENEPRYRDLIAAKIAELVPRAALVFVPPYADDPSDFTSYDFHSSQIYGFAYRTLKRRMAVIGVEIPPAERLMPGAIAD